ncbi:MAG: hypothetical protein HOM21_01830, partial [Halobacteriovoraceae bacterium]|nr:hypothetical protein [Halobacteriovoraceae bacterium]
EKMNPYVKLDSEENLDIHSWVFLVSKATVEQMKIRFPERFESKLSTLIYFKKKQMFLLAPREIIEKGSYLTY